MSRDMMCSSHWLLDFWLGFHGDDLEACDIKTCAFIKSNFRNGDMSSNTTNSTNVTTPKDNKPKDKVVEPTPTKNETQVPIEPKDNTTTPATPDPTPDTTPDTDPVVIKKADEVVANTNETVEYFLTYATSETVIDGKTTNVLKTQTFAAIRPRFRASGSESLSTLLLLLVLLHLFK